MSKDKKAVEFSFNDAVSSRADRERKASGKISVGPIKFNKEELLVKNTMPIINEKEHLTREKEVAKYNESITTLDPKYSNLIPINKILVRCFHMAVQRTDAGIILLPKQVVSIPTQAGHGQLAEVDSPYLYQKRAIIVAAPTKYQDDPDSSLKSGNWVQLSNNPLRAISKGKDSQIDLPYAFTHFDWQFPVPPQDITNQHYGYLLVPFHEVEVIVPKT